MEKGELALPPLYSDFKFWPVVYDPYGFAFKALNGAGLHQAHLGAYAEEVFDVFLQAAFNGLQIFNLVGE